jgi:hypothetical protein
MNIPARQTAGGDVYEQASRIPHGGAAVRGFINYLKKYGARKVTNPEP